MKLLCLPLLVLALDPAPRAAVAGGEEEACVPGLWTLTSETYGQGGATRSTPATSAVTCLFDGLVEVAEYRDHGPGGTTRFRGISFHVWEPDHSARTTLWLMVGDPGHTLLVEQMEDGVLLSEGTGTDMGGTFLETSETSFDDDGGYVFDMRRSFDEGETWRPYNVIHATRTSDEVPRAAELEPATARAKAKAGDPSTGVPVLDGFAEVEAITEEVDGRTVRRIRFSSRYAGPNRWRTVTWELGTLEIVDESVPLG